MKRIDTPSSSPSDTGLSSLFKPRAIALVGASDDPYKIGGRPLRYMQTALSSVPMYPVNPTRDQVQGQKAYPSIQDIPDQVDQAILAVPAKRVQAAIEDGLAAGVKSFIMFSAGFAEAGPEGILEQQRLVDAIRAGGARLLGPNAMGLFNTGERIFSTFSSAMDRGIPELGRVGVVSQSGAVGSYLQNLIISRGVKISKFVATGNEADLEASECLEWMASDPDINVLVVYLETCRNGQALKRALDMARSKGKPVVMLKAGRTEAGQSVAASHTGAMAGSSAVFDAVMKALGVYLAASLPELVELTYTFANGVIPEDSSLAIITISGGIGVMATDTAVETGLTLPPMPDATLEKIREDLPLAVGNNPLDTTAATIGDRSIFMRVVENMLASRPFGSVMLFVGNAGLNSRDPQIMSKGLANLRATYPRTQLAICTQSTPENAKIFEEAGCLVYEDPESCIRSFAAAAEFGTRKTDAAHASAQSGPDLGPLPTRPDEVDAAALLGKAGIPFAKTLTATSVNMAVAHAEEVGYPVVLKLRSPDIAHKSEIGGVKIGMANAEDVREAYTQIMENVRNKAPDAEVIGVTVNQMVSGGVQTILGTHLDPTFGPMVMVGLGGIFTEVLKDTVMAPAPISSTEALEMIRALKGFAILDGARGTEKADINALAEAVSFLSQVAVSYGDDLEGAEINPLLVQTKGCMGVDALLIPNKH